MLGLRQYCSRNPYPLSRLKYPLCDNFEMVQKDELYIEVAESEFRPRKRRPRTLSRMA